MPKYRKKPVVIEAERVPVYSEYESTTAYVDDCIELAAWCGGISYMMRNEEDYPDDPDYVNHMLIQTLEGDMKALPGDYVIKGVSGEFYPCKPDIFKATYDSVSE